jgi:hypothetical protein
MPVLAGVSSWRYQLCWCQDRLALSCDVIARGPTQQGSGCEVRRVRILCNVSFSMCLCTHRLSQRHVMMTMPRVKILVITCCSCGAVSCGFRSVVMERGTGGSHVTAVGRMAEADVVAALRGSSVDKLSTRVTRMQRAASTSRQMCGRSKADAKLLLLPAEECTSQQRIDKSARGMFV